jgi:hypothetical protein
MPVLIGAKQNDEGAESDQQSGEPEKMYFHGDLAALISASIAAAIRECVPGTAIDWCVVVDAGQASSGFC